MGPYKRISDRQLRFTKDLLNEIKEKIRKGQSKRSVAKEYGLNESTLRKRLKAGTIPTSLGRFKAVFTENLENELSTKIKKLDELFYGLTFKDLQAIAYQFAEANKLNHPFNKTSKLAGKKWVIQFCKRHNLVVRQPEKVSAARAIGFNKIQISRFFENLKTCLEKYSFTGRSIYNMDETGLLTVPNKIPKVLTPKGKKIVGKIVSGERGQLITAVCCMNARGSYIPPALIYPRKREKRELIFGAPEDTLMMISDSGFINKDLFLIWLKHFTKHAKPNNENPVLLILDNHTSHISLEAISFCRENGIHLLSLPPHSSHRLQPLDVAFFGPLKTAYSQEADKWIVSNPGRVITQAQVASLFGKAYARIASLEKSENSFSATGIWPYNPNIFKDEDFAPSTVTDMPLPTENNNNNIEIIIQDEALNQELLQNTCAIPVVIASSHEFSSSPVLDLNLMNNNISASPERASTPKISEKNNEDIQLIGETTPQPGPSGINTTKDPNECYYVPDREEQHLTANQLLDEIYPLPKAKRIEKQRNRKSKKSEILTSTPYKDSLAVNEKEQTQKLKVKRKVMNKSKGTNPGRKTEKKIKPKKDTANCCIICNIAWAKWTGPDWICCVNCNGWVCGICNEESEDIFYKCPKCDNDTSDSN